MRFGNLKKLAGASLVAAIVAFAATPADAAFKLSLSTDGTINSATSVVIEDNNGGDMNNTPGVILWSGQLGGFQLLVSIGQSKPFIGGNGVSIIDSNFTVTGVGTATIALTDTGFMDIGNGGGYSDIGGTTNGTVNAWAWFDSANAEFGQGTMIGAHGPFTLGAFSDTATTAGLSNTPFSLTSIVQVTHVAGSNNTTTGDHNIRVPEPALLALFGLGLLGIARRRQR
jgi:hypothetical protein